MALLQHGRRRLCSTLLQYRQIHLVSQDLPKSIIFGSCSHQSQDLSYWDTFGDFQPDLIILAGDNVYGGDNLNTLDDAYTAMKLNSSVQRAFHHQTILATLDDNDYGNAGDACSANPNKEHAKRMCLDFFQVSKEDARWTNGRGAYTSYQWDDDLQIILLDLRYHKSPFLHKTGHGGCHIPDYMDTSKTMLGKDQWSWLEQQLLKPAHVRIIVSPLQLLANGHHFECWNMLPLERDRMLQLLLHTDRRDEVTMVLSGDRHASAMYQKDALVEITSSSLTHTIGKGKLDHEMDQWRSSDFIYENNFGRIQLDWTSNMVQIGIHHAITGKLIQDWSYPKKPR